MKRKKKSPFISNFVAHSCSFSHSVYVCIQHHKTILELNVSNEINRTNCVLFFCVCVSLGGQINLMKLVLADAYPCSRFQWLGLTEFKDSKGN